MTTTAVDTQVQDALARLCNAECMLQLIIQASDEHLSDMREWRINEALRGVQKLLDGCYVTLPEAV